MREPLSVLIPCGNSADVIEDCLRSVSWADEIVVVDSFSHDGTLEIARRYATRILQHEYIDSATQKNWMIPQVTYRWLLIVDTDERVTLALRAEIESVLERPGEYVGFKIPRLNHAWGAPLRYGGNYPDFQLRLFCKDKGRYQTRRVHAHVLLDGHCGILQNPLLHFGQRSINQFIEHFLGDFTTWEAEERLRQGRHFSVTQATSRTVATFLHRFFYLQGFRDGVRGFIWSGMMAAYVFLTFAKMWEIEKNSISESPPEGR